MNGSSGPASWRCDCSRRRPGALSSRRAAGRPWWLSAGRSASPACRQRETGTIRHACRISSGPGRIRKRAKSSQTDTRGGASSGTRTLPTFCSLSPDLGRPVTHMVRGHDHVEERYAVYPAYRSHPVLTTVALSRRLSRESFGPYERIPTIAQYVEGALPQRVSTAYSGGYDP